MGWCHGEPQERREDQSALPQLGKRQPALLPSRGIGTQEGPRWAPLVLDPQVLDRKGPRPGAFPSQRRVRCQACRRRDWRGLPEHIGELLVPVDVHLKDDGKDLAENENIELTSPVVRPTATRLCSSKKAKAHGCNGDVDWVSYSLFLVLKSTISGL